MKLTCWPVRPFRGKFWYCSKYFIHPNWKCSMWSESKWKTVGDSANSSPSLPPLPFSKREKEMKTKPQPPQLFHFIWTKRSKFLRENSGKKKEKNAYLFQKCPKKTLFLAGPSSAKQALKSSRIQLWGPLLVEASAEDSLILVQCESVLGWKGG